MDRMGVNVNTSTLKSLLDIYLKQEQLDKAEKMLNRLESAMKNGPAEESPPANSDASAPPLAIVIPPAQAQARPLPNSPTITIHTTVEAQPESPSKPAAPEPLAEAKSATKEAKQSASATKPDLKKQDAPNPEQKSPPNEATPTEEAPTEETLQPDTVATVDEGPAEAVVADPAPTVEKAGGFKLATLFDQELQGPVDQAATSTTKTSTVKGSTKPVPKATPVKSVVKEEPKQSAAKAGRTKPEVKTEPAKEVKVRKPVVTKVEQPKVKVPQELPPPAEDTWPKEDAIPMSQLRRAFAEFGGSEGSSTMDAEKFLSFLQQTNTQLNSRRGQTTLADAREFLSMVCPDAKFESFCDSVQSMGVVKKIVLKVSDKLEEPEVKIHSEPLLPNPFLQPPEPEPMQPVPLAELPIAPEAASAEPPKRTEEPAANEKQPPALPLVNPTPAETTNAAAPASFQPPAAAPATGTAIGTPPQAATAGPPQNKGPSIDPSQLAFTTLPESALADLFLALGGVSDGFIDPVACKSMIASVPQFRIHPGAVSNTPEAEDSFLASLTTRPDGKIDFANFCAAVRTVPALCRLINDLNELDLSDSDSEK